MLETTSDVFCDAQFRTPSSFVCRSTEVFAFVVITAYLQHAQPATH